jgi:hypothetical protein
MANNFPNILPSFNADFVNGIYVDPRITFTRAGTRTYYGQEVVKAEENLLLQSQDYTATWTVTNLTPVTGKSAPNGTSTATEFTASAANAVLTQAITAVAGSYTFSVFLRRVTGTGDIQIAADNGTWTTKVITGTWARYDVTQTLTAGSKTAGIRVVTNTDAIEVWGAQLEFRSSLTGYTPTTTQPITRYQRLVKTAAANEWPREFDPVTGECLGRSVWESRTNLLTYSEDFTNAAWTKTASSISADVSIDLMGGTSARKWVPDSGSASSSSVLGQTITAAAGTYTESIFVKAAGFNSVVLNFRNNNSVLDQATVTFDLAAATISTAAAVQGSYTSPVATITNIGNGWRRISLTCTTTGTAFRVRLWQAVSAGDGSSGVIVWGAQLEAGAFATPYIPTVASQVTRVADSAVMTGVNFSSWFNPEQGAFVVDGYGAVSGRALVVANSDVSTANDRLLVYNSTSGQFGVTTASVLQANLDAGTPSFTSYDKYAASYKFNDFAASLNGGAVATDTVGVLPVVNQLQIGNQGGSIQLNGYIKRLTYYPQALTSANLQAITR